MANNSVLKLSRDNIKRNIKGKTRELRKHLFKPVFIYVLMQALAFYSVIIIMFTLSSTKLIQHSMAHTLHHYLLSWALFLMAAFINTVILGFAAGGFFCIIQSYLKQRPPSQGHFSPVFSYYKQVIIFSLLITLALFCIHIIGSITANLVPIPGITATLSSTPFINVSILGLIQIALLLIIFFFFFLSLCYVISLPKMRVNQSIKAYRKFIASRVALIIRLSLSILLCLASAAATMILFAIGASLAIMYFIIGVGMSGGFVPAGIIAILLIILALLVWLCVSSLNIIVSYSFLFINSLHQHLQEDR